MGKALLKPSVVGYGAPCEVDEPKDNPQHQDAQYSECDDPSYHGFVLASFVANTSKPSVALEAGVGPIFCTCLAAFHYARPADAPFHIWYWCPRVSLLA
jgi:hypothetical protein